MLPDAEIGVQALFARDLALSDRITRETWQRAGPRLRLQDALASAWACWL